MEYVYTIIGISIIFIATTLGSSLVFFVKRNISEKLNQMIYGFSSGVMFSAAVFGLLVPAFEDKSNTYMPEKLIWIIPIIGFIIGCLFIFMLDKLIPHIHKNNGNEFEEGLKNTHVSRGNKLFLAVTLHNVPEGLDVGIAYGIALSNLSDNSLLIGALMLAIGIAIQNFPEGAAVSIPLLEEGYTKKRAFLFGTLSGLVEPIAAIIGLFLAYEINGIMPWGLSFAAGCMIYVVIEDLFPILSKSKEKHYGNWSFIIGFTLMMILDVVATI